MKKNITWGVLLLITLLVSCKISKNIEAPKPDLPSSFRNATPTEDTATIADVSWKNFFTDVTLQKLINQAIVKNYDMQVAVQNIEAAHLLLQQVKWNYLPALNLNVSASTTRSSDNSITKLSLSQNYNTTNHIEDYSAALLLSWEADIWDKIHNQTKSAVASYLQTTEARNTIQTNIVATVSQGYYNLLRLDEQVSIAKENVVLNDSILRIIKLQFDAGQVTLLAVQQAETQKLSAADLIPQFEQDITLQENAIKLITGELPASITRTATLNDITFNQGLPTGLPAHILSRRPDIRAKELALTIANANVGIQKADMYPALRITAEGGINSFKSSNWFNIPASLFGLVAGSVAQPLLNHKVLKTNYEVAEVNRQITVIQFRQSVLSAVEEVSNALVKIETLKDQHHIIQNKVTLLQQAIGNARMLFQNGMANYLEVIIAQSNLLQSELELASVKSAELTAVSELYRAVGGGWR